MINMQQQVFRYIIYQSYIFSLD